MKISLEFANAEQFFTELPKFAELIQFSAGFATFSRTDERRASTLGPVKPLPETEQDAAAGITTVRGTPDQLAAAMGMGEKEEAVATASAPAQHPEEPPAKAPEEPKTNPKPEDVRRALNSLIVAKKRDEVKTILGKFGATNLSGISGDDYAAVIAMAEEVLKDA